MKGKLLKKLKSIKPIGYLKPYRVLHVNASDGFVDNFSKNSNVQANTQIVCKEEEPTNKVNQISVTMQEPEIIDVSDLMRDLLDDDEMDEIDNKENIKPQTKPKAPSVFSTEFSSSLKP